MIVETIVALLQAEPNVAALVADRIYPVQAPDASTFPLIVVSKVSGVGQYTLDGDAGLEDGRVQIDCLAPGYAEAVAIKTAVRRYLSGFAGGRQSGDPCAIQGAFCINDSDGPDSAFERAGPRLRRRMLEFQVWNNQV